MIVFIESIQDIQRLTSWFLLRSIGIKWSLNSVCNMHAGRKKKLPKTPNGLPRMKVASGRLCPSDGDVPVCRIGVVLFLLIDKDSQGHGVQTSPCTAESRSPFINYSFSHVPSCSLLQTLNRTNFFNAGNHVYLSIHSLRYPLSISTLIRYSIFQNLVFPSNFSLWAEP